MTGTTLPGRRRLAAVVAGVAAQILMLAITLGPLLDRGWERGYRLYFSTDQLSYAAIALNVANGGSARVEPFTQSGVSHYPSGWYTLIGLLARFTGLPVHLSWTILGILAIGSAIGVVGFVAFRMSGRWWAPLVPGVLLWTGTLSSLRDDYWYSILSMHAVLWGPYAALFTLNAETAGLSLAAIATALLVLAMHGAVSPTTRRLLVIASSALVGITANIQTYSFFSALILTGLMIVWFGVIDGRRRRAWVLSLVMLIVVIALGRVLVDIIGPLPLLALLLAAMLPAVLARWREHARLIVVSAAALLVMASPQVVHTLIGFAQDDPFLGYREASTKDLGVPFDAWLLGTLTLLLLGSAAWLGLRGPWGRASRAMLLALLSGMLLMGANDVWGFNQEPYRLWIEFHLLTAVLLAIPLAVATTNLRRPDGARVPPQPRLLAFTALLIAAVITFTVGLRDVLGFWGYARDAGVLAMDSPRMDAMRDLASRTEGRIAADPCIDPQHLKLATGRSVAYLNLGLAWPKDFAAVRVMRDPQTRTVQDAEALRNAGVRFVVGDDSCTEQWEFTPSERVIEAGTIGYTRDGASHVMTLWRVLPR